MSNFSEWSIYKEWKKNWLEHNNKKQSKMKKHNFNDAIEIFKAMFEGWSVVTKDGFIGAIEGFDMRSAGKGIVSRGCTYMEHHISHLEQTKPINGDEVWAWDDKTDGRDKRFYVGKTPYGKNICCSNHGGINVYDNVELISPTRKITIQEATEMLKGIVTEPFEIIKE